MTPQILAPIVAVYTFGNGLPMYMFANTDVISAILKGYITVIEDKAYLTPKAENFLKALRNS